MAGIVRLMLLGAGGSGGGGGGGGTTYVTWDTATASNVTFSGGNLIATSAGGGTDHGAHVISTSGKTTGKYYFEVTLTTHVGAGNTGVAIATPTSTYAAMGGSGITGNIVFSSGNIYSNGGSGGQNLGGLVTGNIIGVAVDLDNRKIWFRKAPTGSWNASSGTANDPATNTGGIVIPAGTMVPWVNFNATGNVYTANFGASAFSSAVPSGFTSGWPV